MRTLKFMNYLNPQSRVPTKNDSNVISVLDSYPVGIKNVAGISGLLNSTLCPIYSQSFSHSNSHAVICSIVGLDKQDKAWMLRKNITVGRRKNYS